MTELSLIKMIKILCKKGIKFSLVNLHYNLPFMKTINQIKPHLENPELSINNFVALNLSQYCFFFIYFTCNVESCRYLASFHI